MNKAITRGIAMDIDSVRQYLNLANHTINRAIGAIQAERMTATLQEHRALLNLQDQCTAELKLINHASDGIQGIDTEFLKPELATKKHKGHEDLPTNKREAVHHA